MTTRSKFITGLIVTAGILIIYFVNNQNTPMAIISVDQVNEVVSKIGPAPLHLSHTDKVIENPILPKDSDNKTNTHLDNIETKKISTFSVSGIATPDNLPEYLLNTPFTTLDINFENLSALKTGDKISIPLFSGDSINLVINKNSSNQNLSIIKGYFEAEDINLPASLTYREGSIFGSIATSEGEYRISKISGVHVIYKIPDLEGQPNNDAMVFVPHTSN
tara:strand:- start:10073 stop:10732 length:660 start_codon:yes stop_codon:yes gene_type:complete